MDLKKLTSKQLVRYDITSTDKAEVIRELVHSLYKENIINDEQTFYDSVMEREGTSATGMENGLAIPHGKSETVNEAAFAVARLERPVKEWESIDPDNQVELVFLLAIPTSEAGSTHLNVLAELSTRLMNKAYYTRLLEAKDSDDFMKALDSYEKAGKKAVSKEGKTILAVTSCASGIAHTYMAAEALEKAADKLGYTIWTEKQGATGIEDRISAEMIKKADGIVFATDLPVKEKARFAGLPYVQTRVADPLKNSESLLTKVVGKPDGKVKVQDSDVAPRQENHNGEKQGVLSEMVQAVMTGISYMIPLLVAGGLMMGIAKLGAMPFGLVNEINDISYATHSNEFFVILHHLDKLGFMIFQFIYAIFAAYTAYSIADRVGIVAGFVGGLFANGVHFRFWGIEGGVASGFLGALVLGLLAGYLSRFLNEKIKLNRNLQAMKPMFLIPAVSVLVIFLANFYIVDPVFGGLNQLMEQAITASAEGGEIILSSIIAAATAFDLGGPVNKAAGAINIGLAADGIFPLTARVLSIVIPPIGLGLATVLDKYIVGKRVFNANLRVTGNTSILLGFLAISEGAIPFMLQNPIITIPINIIGAILGSITAVLLGAVQWLPLPAVWGWPLVDNVLAYIIGLLVGTLFIALSNIFIRNNMIKRGKMTV
ncbi:PTS system IIA component, Fru family /PTS system IIB component, Fru family /PTS system IIC component, Fru family [Alkalibacterium putridalgicola]|uniref:PTS fructose transporter subunit IIABC n=1 Tax=Alkalibacterium putridalgicola TaxID=426703 RepID=A0A1H7TEZ2_9LACT|nr:fructose-specific PTS transporter subunit EIIC [Alkalibacterium putridalgicola]GEK89436.1 PTS fructose transporter subunit IIABC [Alkalibacterium putridalgicola]SEL83115.1 PTS system IIA component, Fru family /PTS system IIB component, Fru family /PTS system IIC component, Fru family [Alkalibacterium putridalgicola]